MTRAQPSGAPVSNTSVIAAGDDRDRHGAKIPPAVAVIANKFVTDHNRHRPCDNPLPNAALPMIGPLQRIITWMVVRNDDKIFADITTADGSLFKRLEVDRHTGQMQDIE